MDETHVMKSLVLYCYKESPETITNLAFFLKHGLSDSADFVFIVNNMKCSLPFPSNTTVIRRQEDEYDLLTYKWYFDTYNPQYTNYYFINSSCIGPFLPPVITENWITIFNKKLESYDLIAPIIDFPPDSYGNSLIGNSSMTNIPFLHTYMFGTKSPETLKLLFGRMENNSQDSAISYERMLTSLFLTNGKKIFSFLMAFKNIDVNNESLWNWKLWNPSNISCYEVPENYFSIDVNPLEVVFVKNIRKIHKHREESRSGLSQALKNLLTLYISWY